MMVLILNILLQVAQANQIVWKSRLECRECRGFLEMASARALHLPSVVSRVFQMEVMSQVSGMCRNGPNGGCVPEQFQVRVQDERGGGSEFV